MKELVITAYPYATQTGFLPLPHDMDEDEAKEYAEEHWREIDFDAPSLDYRGTDFDVEIEDAMLDMKASTDREKLNKLQSILYGLVGNGGPSDEDLDFDDDAINAYAAMSSLLESLNELRFGT